MICTFAQKPQQSHLVRLPGKVAVLGSLVPSGGQKDMYSYGKSYGMVKY